MKIRTAIIDDEPIALEKLRSYVNKIPYLELIAEFDNALDALEFLTTEQNIIDLLITDINMPDLDGLSALQSLSAPPMTIFTTAYAEYAVDSYRLPTVDYLLKPYSFADLQRAALKAKDEIAIRNHTNNQTVVQPANALFIKVDYRYVRVDTNDIRYIKGYGEYLQIFLTSASTPLLTLSSFASIKSRLSNNFIQVHRSFIVNMNHALRIEKMRIVMDEDTFIPVSDSYKLSFQRFLTENSVGGSI